MTGGLYSRVKTWGTTDTLTASDLNAEFDNVLNNFIPTMMQGYSVNVAQMQTQVNPGAVGTESLAAALSGELERLRFQIAAITGNTYWYSSPITTLAALNTALGATNQANSVTSGAISTTSGQPLYIIPSGTTNSITIAGATTPLVYKVAGTTYTLSSNLVVTALTSAPSTSNTLKINDQNIDGSSWTKLVGEYGSTVTVATMGTNVTSQVGNIVAFKTASTEYLIGRIETTTTLVDCYRGFFFSNSSALLGRTVVTNNDTWTIVKLAWIFLSTTQTATAVYTNPRVSGTAPSSPATGDYWFDTVNNIWKTYNSTTWVASNSTLIGQVITDSSGVTQGARCVDFFSNYSELNSAELIVDQNTNTLVRSKYENSQVSIYGTALIFQKDYLRWDSASNMDSGVTFSASTFYYFYLTAAGNTVISDVAPFDRRTDLKGYYHPKEAWRCLGYAYSNASLAFDTLSTNPLMESFFVADNSRSVAQLTAAVATFPAPYIIQQRTELYEMNAAGASFTQVLPPPSTWKGQRKMFIRTDNTPSNSAVIQAWGNIVQATTANMTVGTAVFASVGLFATTSVGNIIDGTYFPPQTTIVSGAGTATITAAQTALYTSSGVSLTIANSTGMSGRFRINLVTQYESVELYSDGTQVLILSREIPVSTVVPYTPTWTNFGSVTTNSFWQRRGTDVRLYLQVSTGTVVGSVAAVSLPNGWLTPLWLPNNPYPLMTSFAEGSATAYGVFECIASIGVNTINFANTSSGATGYTPINGNAFTSTTKISYVVDVPIAGWER